MTFFTHAVAGAAVGSFIPNPWLAGIAGFISHYVLDFIPHWDPIVYGDYPKSRKTLYGLLLLLDILLAIIVLIMVSPWPNLFVGAVFGILVDVDNFLQYQNKFHPNWFPITHTLFKINAHQEGSRWHSMTNMYLGLFNQSWVTLLGLIVLAWQLLNP